MINLNNCRSFKSVQEHPNLNCDVNTDQQQTKRGQIIHESLSSVWCCL